MISINPPLVRKDSINCCVMPAISMFDVKKIFDEKNEHSVWLPIHYTNDNYLIECDANYSDVLKRFISFGSIQISPKNNNREMYHPIPWLASIRESMRILTGPIRAACFSH